MVMPRRRPPRELVAVALAASLSLGGLCHGMLAASAATGAPSSTTTPSRSSGSSSRSDDVDVLTATREEVGQRIAELDEQYAAQQTALDVANAQVEAAQQAVDRAQARVALAQNEVEIARETVRAYAVEAYIHPPAQDSLRVLSIAEADDAAYASEVMKILADERHKVVDILVGKQAIAAKESAAADAAAAAAAAQADAARAQLAQLDTIRSEQDALAAQLDDRLDRALAEAAALAEVDRQMAAELAAQETALRQAAPVSQPKPQTVSAPGTTSPPATASGPTGPSPTAPPATTAPPGTTPPPPSGIVTWSDVVSVGGIYVHTSIAGQLRGLLDAATAAGFSLRGGGYRDSAAQIATRRANCGPSYYDIYQKPASQCTPPTAIPGRSMHEQGRAIDFTSGGVLISSRSNPAFVWLSQNAARFGFYNLPSEPWHWSTNGN
jgi:uncharacterized coiled-coil protein SlyX